MKQQNDKRAQKKALQAEREKLDNKVVLATAIALTSAMIMVFLYNWFKSIYALQTKTLIEILMWVGIVGVAVFLILYFVKKERKFLFVIPYFAVGAVFMREILVGTMTGWVIALASKIPFLHIAGNATTLQRFNFVYICLAVYLVASYIYYGIKIKKLGK